MKPTRTSTWSPGRDPGDSTGEAIPDSAPSLSVRAAFEGKEVLVTGVTGFVGKVLLLTLLERVGTPARVHVLIRPSRERDALERFEHIVNTSPAFARLHEAHGRELGAWLRERVVVHSGDVTAPTLGLDADVFEGRLDLIVNCAASVDFRPDVRAAVRTNIGGALSAAELARATGARLLQVSTCYVAGRREGWIGERPVEALPSGEGAFDAEAELADLKAAIAEREAWLASEEFERALVREAVSLTKGDIDNADDLPRIRRQVERLRHKREEHDWERLGVERADARGWPNTYTYVKAIAEGLLRARYPDVAKVTFRPAVVESARAYPMPGWNEGFNTCGPLAYLIGTWFKALPGRAANPFDVVPVDMVAEGLVIAGAALLEGVAHPVYQCGTSDGNLLTLGRANELTALTHRRWGREGGGGMLERLVKPRADTTLYDAEHPLSVESAGRAFELAARVLRGLPEATPDRVRDDARRLATKIERGRRELRTIETMVDAFTPFTRELRQRFEARNLASHRVAEEDLAWAPAALDWRDYWMNVHMPGMRTWSFPLFEGKKPPSYTPAHPVTLGEREEAAE